MKTITLKTDEPFFEKVTALAKELHLSKSELIRQSISEFETTLKRNRLKEKMQEVSLRVRDSNQEIIDAFDALADDGLQ